MGLNHKSSGEGVLQFSLENLAMEPVWSHVSAVALAKQIKILNESREILTTEIWVSWETPKQVEFPKLWG